MFLQIHSLTSYHATLLNRDDAGLAKRIPFGDATRLRVSSQCLKRHWTTELRTIIEQQHDGWENFESGWRTRNFFDRVILPEVDKTLRDDFLDDKERQAIVIAATWDLACGCFTKIKKKDAKKLLESDKLDVPLEMPDVMKIDPDKGERVPRPEQAALFGKPEANYLVSEIKNIARESNGAIQEIRKGIRQRVLLDWRERNKEGQTMLNALIQANLSQTLYAGIEGALFGRFVTSDILARSDAAVHVAHAFTVHKLDTEVDYFTVVDDLNRDEETGAAHAGDMELGAGLFYGYVAVDIPLLVSNLSGCDAKAWKAQDFADARAVLKGLIRAIATVSPGAKLGATAPYAFSDFVLLETGGQQPRALANAYLQALPLHGDPMQAAADALGKHLAALNDMYGQTSDTRVAASTRAFDQDLAEVKPLDAAIETALDAIFSPERG